MPEELRRLINIIIAFGIALIIVISALVFIGSYEISKINQNIATSYKELNERIESIEKIDYNKLAEQVVKLIPVPKDGIDGYNGVNGTNGKDSVSTTTIIERQTVIEKEVPPRNGDDGKTPVFGQLPDGRIVWKYLTDRDWLLMPIVEVNL